jgi:3-hydroxyacyl-CoA dehydrogenase/enoyl-CoA hydratase/3-hydroxybutyryl-CoA epimerase
MAEKSFNNWRYEVDDQNIFWLSIDRKGRKVNSLGFETVQEFVEIIDVIKANKKLKGVVIKSGKDKGFIAGADITEFTQLKDQKEAEALIGGTQKALLKLEKLKIPSVVLIDGFALGGGFEFALACTYRIALDSPEVKIGLPEVKLGIHPGWGGSVRLPKLIGAIPAMKLILTGKLLDARKSKKLGMVDDVVRTKALMHTAAVHFITKKPKPHKAGMLAQLSNATFIRPLLASKFRSATAAKVKQEHYPAPFAVIDYWQQYGVTHKAYKAEVKSIGKLFLHPTSRNLVRVFFLQEQMKALAKGVDFNPKHVHVIGAGTMGGDIAAWCALRGFTVTLQDREPEFIAPAIKRATKLFKRKTSHKRDAVAAMDRLIPDVKGDGVAKADVVIEAIFEDLKVKTELYKSIEPKLKEGALLATNTSSLKLEDLSKALKNPERLVGVHFFNPVAMMMLVEVVRSKKSAAAEVEKALAFVSKISKLPLPVASSPAFLINRILMPYMREAFVLLDEGVAAASIDAAAVDFGMPLGPLELADVVGLDVCLSVSKVLSEAFDSPIPESMQKFVKDGNLGKKTGTGVYTYREGKPVKVALYQQGEPPKDLTDRLILSMVNEAIACLDEKVIEDKDLLDAGMIFGTGWAPFRGGPINYVKEEGAEKVHKRLEKLQKAHGDRFAPNKGWKELLKNA